jgi:hypothetical protein
MLKNLGFPVISASRSKEQPYRIIRLNIVHGFALGRAKSEGCSWEIEHNLLGLNDNRGALRVIWLFEPSDSAKAIVYEAWQAQHGEHAIEHWALADNSEEQSSFSAFRPEVIPNYHGDLFDVLQTRRATLIHWESSEDRDDHIPEPLPQNLY